MTREEMFQYLDLPDDARRVVESAYDEWAAENPEMVDRVEWRVVNGPGGALTLAWEPGLAPETDAFVAALAASGG